MQGILLLGRQWLRRRRTQLRLWELWRPRHHGWMQRHLLLQHRLPVDWHHWPRCRQVSTLVLLSSAFQLLFRNIHIQDGHKPRVQSPRDHLWEQRSPMHPLLQVRKYYPFYTYLNSIFISFPFSQPNDCGNQQLYPRPTLMQPARVKINSIPVRNWEIVLIELFNERW